MCGRYSLSEVPSSELIIFPENSAQDFVAASYNLAPTQDCLVMAMHIPGYFQLYRWGLIPAWAKDEKIGSMLIKCPIRNH